MHIGNLEGILRDRDVHIGNLDAILRDKDVQIANLAATVQDKDFVLNNIYRSRGWRVLSLYYRIRDKVLPPNSLRRRSVKFLADFARNPMSVIRSTHGRGAKSIKGEGEGGEKRFICGIETDLSQPVIVGKGNVLHLSGWCYHTTLNIKRVYILVDGIPQRIHNIGMARVDVLADQCREVDRNGNSLNSGFWSLIPFSEIEFPRKVSLTIRALFDNGEQCDQDLGMITLSPSGEIASDHLFERLDVSSQDPLIAICMTTYNPDLKMFTRQVDSIIQQTFKNWVCIISDDGSRRDIFEGIRGIASRDARFYISRNSANLGFYNNFEKCLSMVPQKAMYVAFSDQDDYWHADKLAELVSRFDQTTMLAYSDMNIVNDKGELLHNTYWTTRKNNYTHLDSLLFANTVTGAASMIRRDLMPYLLPFPKKIGDSYHDHWMASIALTKGTMAYVDRPLYDYYQHADNIIGHYTRSNGITVRKIKEAFQRVRSGLKSGEMSQHIKSFLWHSRDVYLNDVVRIILISNILLLRCGDAAIRKRSVIKQFAGFEQSAFGIFVQGVKGKLLRRSTLGAEFYCFRSVIMQKLMNSYFRLRKDRFLSRYTGLVPSKVSSSAVKVESVGSVDVIRQKIAPLTLKVSAEAKKRVNLLIPTIDFKYFFGGYIGKFNFALRLADAGFSVRIIMTDYCNYDLPAWRREIRNYEGLEDFFDRIDVVYAFDRAVPVEVNEKDVFIASTWWTAHIAHKAVTDLKAERFLYLIQEYEPFTFPMGTFYALAQQTYGFPHFAIFSTELLRDYFRRNKLGVFCDLELGERNSVSFENAIQTFSINEQDMRERKPKRFLYYARPEQHAARNMFDLGVLALNKVIEEGYFDSSGWEFYGIGSVSNIESIRLSKDVSMKLLQRVTLKEYADLLPGFDLGLSLMFTPHPSLPPLEMAAAGMMVVTNTFENKTGERLKEISSNIIAVDPTLEGVRLGLIAALEKVHDYRGRLEGSHVNWSSSWPESFNDEIMAKIKNFI
ncbi:MAG: glycosyltransferase [Nitrospirae bacterium]|nr:glycosyltransferase [Nitrospirota bacterium]